MALKLNLTIAQSPESYQLLLFHQWLASDLPSSSWPPPSVLAPSRSYLLKFRTLKRPFTRPSVIFKSEQTADINFDCIDPSNVSNTATYASSEWDWLKGALSTVDRDYGSLLNRVFHHLTDAHVAHHLFATIPHYHVNEATKAIKPILGEYYYFDDTPIIKALWREAKECAYVEPNYESSPNNNKVMRFDICRDSKCIVSFNVSGFFGH
ncbi:hypothetical protein G4B88_028988 [Cannabis sativa]|uniref:Fatty acid desaturase domain-containing protein n=1 Tax=Cannabis sativa TaxID=3483 RepID=A0A7J6HN21_CANSA|nr:hypothetical protein G4B88_028988 [Cannabis sativa]